MKYIPVTLRRITGFTLIEMAIVLFIVALLLGGLLPTISSQVEQRRVNETRKQLDEIQQALIGYAIANGRLPCPAKSAADGTENRIIATGTCTTRWGLLPWTELGVSKTDSWNRIFIYSASTPFTNSTAPFNFNSARDITIKTRDPNTGSIINLSKADDIPAIVLSAGPNGIFATTDIGLVIATTSTAGHNNVDDQSGNIIGNVGGASFGRAYMSRDSAAPVDNTDAAFDDLVVWISPNILFNRMVAAGKLP